MAFVAIGYWRLTPRYGTKIRTLNFFPILGCPLVGPLAARQPGNSSLLFVFISLGNELQVTGVRRRFFKPDRKPVQFVAAKYTHLRRIAGPVSLQPPVDI